MIIILVCGMQSSMKEMEVIGLKKYRKMMAAYLAGC